MADFIICGPYKYSTDVHLSINVYGLGGILAAFYVFDGDIAAAMERAELFVEAMSARQTCTKEQG